MIYPIGCRRNNRYRGPVESFKTNMSNAELKRNIDILYTTLNQFEIDASNVKLSITSDDRIELANRKRNLNDQINNVMEAFEYGYK